MASASLISQLPVHVHCARRSWYSRSFFRIFWTGTSIFCAFMLAGFDPHLYGFLFSYFTYRQRCNPFLLKVTDQAYGEISVTILTERTPSNTVCRLALVHLVPSGTAGMMNLWLCHRDAPFSEYTEPIFNLMTYFLCDASLYCCRTNCLL